MQQEAGRLTLLRILWDEVQHLHWRVPVAPLKRADAHSVAFAREDDRLHRIACVAMIRWKGGGKDIKFIFGFENLLCTPL